MHKWIKLRTRRQKKVGKCAGGLEALRNGLDEKEMRVVKMEVVLYHKKPFRH